MKHYFSLILILFALSSQAQYWFGAKAGSMMTFHDYQSKFYRDTFDIANDIGFQIGGAATYTASNLFAVKSEITYEHRQKKLVEIPGMAADAKSDLTSHYLTIPILMQVNVGRGLVSFYANGGIKLNFWLASKGVINLEEFAEFDPGEKEYKVVYNQKKSTGVDKLAMVRPNRVQYGFTAGAGTYITILDDARMFVDFRYAHTHSNLGFNDSPDFEFDNYYENFEYRHHSINISVGYEMMFNAQLKRKGASTNKESKRKR